MARYLVVAHQTSETQEFIDTVRAIAERDGDARFVTLVPETHVEHLATWTEGESRAVALKKAAAARRRLEGAGVNIEDTRVGDSRPFYAITDILGDEQFDEIIVSTFPPGISRWLKADLIRRLGRATDIPVTYLIANRDK